MDFIKGPWVDNIDVANFIALNYREYKGDNAFLCPPTQRTKDVLVAIENLLTQERNCGGVLDIDTETVAGINAYQPGYILKDQELIVGLQTDAPLKRAVNPVGGMRMVRQACDAYGYKLSESVEKAFEYRQTHNDLVFSIYTSEMRKARKAGILTGLPDAYGRGRIIGDYRRVALYGVDKLIDVKHKDKLNFNKKEMSSEVCRQIAELDKQITALKELKEMARSYGYDISEPACNAKEAIQWTYFAYLAAVKEQNGAAMSLGRVSTFFDIYIEKDIEEGMLTETEAQELIDDFVLKLRLVRHLRTPDYNELFAGDPTWVTECVGGMFDYHRSLVTKTSYRVLHTLYNLKSSPEPNLTVLWSKRLPDNFKKYCAKVSIDTGSIQYENDDLMRPLYGNDYGIACCVSAMALGKEMQFFGARCNLPKLLLLALNGGLDTETGIRLGPSMPVYDKSILDYDEVVNRLSVYREWLAKLYVNTMNVIHYAHDTTAYESLQMSLHDTDVIRDMAFGIAGLSVVVDSLSAIKYGKVSVIKNKSGFIVDFANTKTFPLFGNDDDRVDQIATEQVKLFYQELRKNKTYRNARHTLSLLTITSNVMYGKKTGATPDGRKKGQPFAPGANPMHGREHNGALAALNSVAKLEYQYCRDGISNTLTILPNTLGDNTPKRISNLVCILDGYFKSGGHHLNVNVLDRETLLKAYENSDLYPNLTIRVSGYAVNFNKLSKEHQKEVIDRTFHEMI